MAKTIDKQTMLDLIAEAKRTDPEAGSFAEWLAEYLVEHLPTLTPPNEPLTIEQLRKIKGEWTPGDSICPVCEKNKFDGLDADIWADWMPSFCPNCGAPMTDEAVQMVMERLEALKDASN